MYRYAALVVLLSSACVFLTSHGVEVEVKDGEGELCLYANLTVDFSVSYQKTDNKTGLAQFDLPSFVWTNGSECDSRSSVLKLTFRGHVWSVNFTLDGDRYRADVITFSYDLSDKTDFPDAALNDTVSVSVTPDITDVVKDTCYACQSRTTIQTRTLNQTLWDVLLQAFVSNNSRSGEVTRCAADLPVTTAPPPPPTHAPTSAPTTNSSSNSTTSAPPPPTTPTPTLPPPAVGKYSVKTDANGTACLLADFGLRIGLKQGQKYQEMNFDPNGTTTSGRCGVNSSDLTVVSSTMTITLSFTNDTKKFHLQALNVTGKTSSGVAFTEANATLSLWQAAVGASYMCNKEQNYSITSALTLFTFDLRVQPFAVKKGVFSTAEECPSDAESFLVPVAVGVSLLVLILIVLAAFFIGRKRNAASGYESF